jgi:hypothetical protein
MPTLVRCPSCERKLRIPDTLLGKRVKCPTCGTTFAGEEEQPAGNGVPARREDEAPEGPRSPRPARKPRRASAEETSCPACAEPVPAGTDRCPACGTDLTEKDRQERDERDEEDDHPRRRRRRQMRRDALPHRGGLLLTLGILSICASPVVVCCGVFGVVPAAAGLVLGILAWAIGRADLAKMDAGTMDDEGRGSTQGGMICGIIGTVLNALGVVVAIGLLVFVIGMSAASNQRPFPAPGPAAGPRRNFSVDRFPLRLQDHLPRAAELRGP